MKFISNKFIFIILLLPFANLLATPWDKIRLNGYSSFEFEQELTNTDIKGDPYGSFDADLFDLVLNIQATDRLRISTDITFEHGASTENGRGNVAIEYAFAEYTVSDLLKVRTGKMFSAFGIYNEIHTAKPATIQVKEPRATNKPDKLTTGLSATRFFPRWNTGIGLVGSSEKYDYIIQLSNGDQEEVDADTNPYEADNNTQKALTGRYRYSPTDNLRLGFSFHHDLFTGANADINKSTEISSYGIQLNWESDKAAIELESVYGSLDFVDENNATVNEKIERVGATLLLSYSLTEVLTPYLEFEYFDPNLDIKEDEISIIIAGINYEIDSNFYLKLEVDRVSSAENNSLYLGRFSSEIKAAVAIGF